MRLLIYKRFLSDKKGKSEEDIAFLDEALKTVIECHLILKNTYVFGYYMKENKNNSLYEHQQELLRRESDLLHERIEMRYLNDILTENDNEKFVKEFDKYKENVLSLIGTTIKFKDNILKDIEEHPEYIDYNAIKNSS